MKVRPFSSYFVQTYVDNEVETGRHREVVGGLWDILGPMQFDILIKYGLQPSHKLLDIGCGSLRGGVHFVRYLEPAGYFGLDLNQCLIDAGYEKELKRLKLQKKLPRTNLVADDRFDFDRLNVKFDFAIAFSVFTHLPLDLIRNCLHSLEKVMAPGGLLFATYFEASEDLPADQTILHDPGGVTTFWEQDPYHQRYSDYEGLIAGTSWCSMNIGDFGHPRSQKLIQFSYQGT